MYYIIFKVYDRMLKMNDYQLFKIVMQVEQNVK